MRTLHYHNLLCLVSVILFTDILTAQQEFPIGTFKTQYQFNGHRYNPALYDTFVSSGMNWFYYHIDNGTKQLLKSHNIDNVIGGNNDGANELIKHYGSSHYSKWQAEENQDDAYSIGIKHKYGDTTTYKGVKCWSSKGLTSPKDSLMYGPHYYQEKIYHRYYYDSTYQDPRDIKYIPRFSMALAYNPQLVNPNEKVCVVKVVNRYYKYTLISPGIWSQGEVHDSVFMVDTLNVSRFNNNGTFNYVKFGGSKDYYMYDTSKYSAGYGKVSNPLLRNASSPTNSIMYLDIEAGTGIQFCIDWLRNDTLCTLYVDFAEVYDRFGWERFIQDPGLIAGRIKAYANAQALNFPNLKYFEGGTEQASIDCIAPHKVVDSLVYSETGRRLWLGLTITTPLYWPLYNGIKLYEKIYNEVQPDFLLVSYLPFYADWEIPKSMEYLRAIFQEAHSVAPSFWYTGQTFGERTETGEWKDWRKPDSTELKASVMLTLAHGGKGIIFWPFDSENVNSFYQDAIVGLNLEPTELFYVIKNNFVPRLKGVLGKTLLGLNYTSNYLVYKYITPTQNPLPQPPTYDYLTIGLQATNHDMNWHVGFLEDATNFDNKYFLMTNLWTNSAKSIQVKVTPPAQAQVYSNYRFRNIEPANNFDITFNTENTQTLSFPAGEGYLFQVAPVVKYGGKLIYSETVSDGTTLYDDLSIENGATLTVNGNYYAKANITVKTGGKIIAGQNAKIIFAVNKGLIIGENAQPYGTSAQIYGTSNNRLTLEFNSNTSTGVEVRFYYALTMSYCDIKNAMVGINAENASSINISNVNFTNCQSSGIVLFSFGNGDSNLPSSTSTISKCIINGSSTGISVVNADEVVITENSINNCNLGIYLNQVNSTHISSNNIIGYSYPNGSTMPGILISSCGGYLRNNTIKYHKYGVQLAYSSPDMGLNTIEQNAQCGLFVDVGSYPNLIQKLVNENCWYPIAGCNIITNNGIEDGPPPISTEINPNGSEIYLNYGDVKISSGGNEISDDRTNISSSLTLPLITGIRGGIGTRELYADRNYWGSTGPSSERFGRLNVIFEPGGDFCPLPDAPCSGNEIIIHTSDGLVIDTLESKQRDPAEITTLEESYSNADKLFLAGEIEQAKIIYQQIVAGAYTSKEKLYAYNRLYEIGKLLREDDSYFTNLQASFENILSTETDTMLIKIYKQNAILCDVGKEEYLTAISKFDNIIQQNPNSEEAVYAEIDIITTALNLDTTNSGLGKIAGGKYLVKGTSDYLTKLNNLLQNKFGVNSENKEQIIPKEYSLYQNYPNPFNPTTTIKFDLPKDGLVQLEIFDILGRRITTLIDEYKTAGRYEQVFKASSLASGVYVYKLQAGDFISSKKMILLK